VEARGDVRSGKLSSVVIGGPVSLTVEDVVGVGRQGRPVSLDPSVGERMEATVAWVNGLFAGDREIGPVYGVNTGFGALAGHGAFQSVATAAELSRRLIVSNACGVGRDLDVEVVRSAMLIQANGLASGRSGVPVGLVETLVAMLNRHVTPIVPEFGSLGASGDLIPLAHVALVATDAGNNKVAGSGEAMHGGDRKSGVQAMRDAEIPQVVLGPKAGLALLNGTSFSTALATLALADAELAVDAAELAVAMSVEAMLGFADAFLEILHAARPHVGQTESAGHIRRLLDGSRLIDGGADHDPVRQPPQDAYAIRCAPQVLGAARDVLSFVRRTLRTELGGVTDNPLIVCELTRPLKAVSGGNFHAEPVAFASDFLTIAVTEIASISERRLARMIDPTLSRGLPPMLIDDDASGLNCGFMLPQILAAALVSDCKTLAHPDSVDSIPTSANQEDHVSMGMNAGRHARQAVWNTIGVIALELHAAAQALDIRCRQTGRSLDDLSPSTRRAYDQIRQAVDYQSIDEVLYPRVEAVRKLVAEGALRQ
jgi:histidine ammonia-lyase